MVNCLENAEEEARYNELEWLLRRDVYKESWEEQNKIACEPCDCHAAR